jgi:hypothetical protein
MLLALHHRDVRAGDGGTAVSARTKRASRQLHTDHITWMELSAGGEWLGTCASHQGIWFIARSSAGTHPNARFTISKAGFIPQSRPTLAGVKLVAHALNEAKTDG